MMKNLRAAAMALALAAVNGADPDFPFPDPSGFLTPDWWMNPPAPAVECGSFRPKQHIKAGEDDADYACILPGQAICRDNGHPFGQWIFGIAADTGCVTLWDPNNKVVYEDFCGATHLCIGQDTSEDYYPHYYQSKERPYLLIYDETTHTYLYTLKCDGVGQEGLLPQLKMTDNSDIASHTPYPINIVKYKKGFTADPTDNNALWSIDVKPTMGNPHMLEGFLYNNPHCHADIYVTPTASPKPSGSPMPSSEPSKSSQPSASPAPSKEYCTEEHQECVFDDCCEGSFCDIGQTFTQPTPEAQDEYCQANKLVPACHSTCKACKAPQESCYFSGMCCSGVCKATSVNYGKCCLENDEVCSHDDDCCSEHCGYDHKCSYPSPGYGYGGWMRK